MFIGEVSTRLIGPRSSKIILLQPVADFWIYEIIETLKTGEEIKLSSFGNFVVREKTARPGRNPKTGEEVTISARKVVTFKAGPKLKLATQLGKK